MFALVVHFTLKDGQGDHFDALMREALTRIQTEEPATLVYACHTVDGDPNARVFYELYRDRAAHGEHERLDHVRSFLGEAERLMAAAPQVTFLHMQEAKGLPGPRVPAPPPRCDAAGPPELGPPTDAKSASPRA